MEDNTYIKISRKLLDWEWYTDTNTKALFLHMLLKANWKDGRFQGEEVPRGSFVSSLQKLSGETSLSMQEVRTALSHLKATGEVTSKQHAKYSIFTVVKYEEYQGSNTQANRQLTGNQQASNKQATDNQQAANKRPTTIEEKKEEKERKNKNNLCKHQDAEELFEHLWKLYPNKKGKGKVSMAAKQRLLKVGQEEMTRAIARYQEELEKDADWRKPQNGSTFFTSGYVDYLDAEWVKSHPGQVRSVRTPEAWEAGKPLEAGESPEAWKLQKAGEPESEEPGEELVGDDW